MSQEEGQGRRSKGRAEREKKGDAHTERMAHERRESIFTVFAAVSPQRVVRHLTNDLMNDSKKQSTI